MEISAVFQMAFNVFLLSSSLLLLLISLILWFTHLSSVRRLVYLGLFVFSCSLWFLIRNPILGVGLSHRPVLETIDVMCQYAITFFSLAYAREFLSGWRKKSIVICQLWTVAYVAVTSLLQFFTAMEYEDFTPIGAASNVIFILLIGFCIGWEALREKDEDSRNLVLSSIPVLVGGLLEIINFLIGNTASTAILFFIGFVIFMLMRLFCFAQHLYAQAQHKAAMEKELTDFRISIMRSQIQPHFLYNTLSGIKQLCDVDPPKASEALGHFAFYLRGNLDSLADVRLVPFEKEMEHMKDYLYLEKMRFSEALNIEWKLTCTDFLLPPLTVQPLVENAIRHGINKKKGGGTLTIMSERLANDVVVTIRDNGVGFDPAEKKVDGRSHVGISNTRERLRALCGGFLLIESEKGVGTVVKVILPQN